jgi:hypothetical protein
LFRLYALVGCGLLLWVWTSSSEVLLPAVVIFGALGVPLYGWDRDRRTARIFYDVDSPELIERLAMVNLVGEQLASSAALWHIFYAARTTDWKTNAGASSLIKRTAIGVRLRSLNGIELNVEAWSIPVGPQQLLFLPDRLLVWDGARVAGVPYEKLTVRVAPSRFIETETLPPDARTVGETWRFVNKNGGPDRRFSNNRRLPILEYGEVEFLTEAGLRVVLQVSRIDAARSAAAALQDLSANATAFGTTAEVARTPSASEASSESIEPPHRDPHPDAEPAIDDDAIASAAATLFRSLAGADRRLTDDELRAARDAVATLLAPEHPMVLRFLDSFRSVPSDDASLARAFGALRRSPVVTRERVLSLCRALTVADGKATPKELERLTEFERALR